MARRKALLMITHCCSGLKRIVLVLPVLAVAPTILSLPHAVAQDVAVAIDASVIVEGRVAKVYQADDESLVQLLVQKSELPTLSDAARAGYPAPGQYVYIHVDVDRGGLLGRLGGRSAGAAIPASRASIRASLKMDPSGQWAPAGQDWFRDASLAGADVATSQLPGESGASGLGLATERVLLPQGTGLKVVSVARNSPAAVAGIEPGDVLVQANRTSLDSQEQLDDIYRRSPRGISLTVRDVRSGRDVDVNVDGPGSVPAAGDRGGEMKALGVTSKLAFYSGKPALEITQVQGGSPADRAGLTAGLLVLQANGKDLGSPEELDAAAKASRGRLNLTVVNPQDRRERTVAVDLY